MKHLKPAPFEPKPHRAPLKVKSIARDRDLEATIRFRTQIEAQYEAACKRIVMEALFNQHAEYGASRPVYLQ